MMLESLLKKVLRRGTGGQRASFERPEFSPAYRRSLALFYCELFAFIAANQRRSDTVELRDLLAGFYIASAEFHGILSYWKDWPSFERLIVGECGRLGPRLLYWSQSLGQAQREGQRKIFHLSAQFKNASPDLKRVWQVAENYASRRGTDAGAPTVIPEDVLLTLATLPEIPLSVKLLESGIDVERLQRVVVGSELGISIDQQ